MAMAEKPPRRMCLSTTEIARGNLLAKGAGPCVFERSAVQAEPGAKRAVARLHRLLGKKGPHHHLRSSLRPSSRPSVKSSCASRLEAVGSCCRGAKSPISTRAIQRITLDMPTPNRA